MADQLVSSDPNWGASVASTAPHMSAAHADSALPASDDSVTLGDLKADPVGSMKKIGAIVGKDATDPKLWLTLAASYFAPKVFNMAGPIVARAASGVKAAGGAALEMADPDLVAIASPRAGAMLRKAQQVRDYMARPAPPPAGPVAAPGPAAPVAVPKAPYEVAIDQARSAVSAPPEMPPAVAAPPSAPSPATLAPAAPSAPAPAGRPVLKPHPEGGVWSPTRIASEVGIQRIRQGVTFQPGEEAAAEMLVRDHDALPKDAVATVVAARDLPTKLKLSPDEAAQYQALKQAGKSGAQAEAAIVKLRALAKGLPTTTEMEQTVADRNATGRWKEPR